MCKDVAVAPQFVALSTHKSSKGPCFPLSRNPEGTHRGKYSSVSKQKSCIRIIGPGGESWTTRRGAKRLIERNLAHGEPESGILHMITSDPRFECAAASANAARLAIVMRNAASCDYRNEVLGLPNFARIGPPRAISHGRAV